MSVIPRSATSRRANLAKLGLTDDVVREVVARGEAERDAVSPNDAPTRAGMNAYFERVLAFRELLAKRGWTANNSKNLCTVISPCGGHAIATATGVQLHGEDGGYLQLKRSRGRATVSAVNAGAQLELPYEEKTNDPEEEPTEPLLWFLIVHRAAGASEVSFELSLPGELTEDGHVTQWIERNQFDPFDLTGFVEVDDEALEKSVEVEVIRKS